MTAGLQPPIAVTSTDVIVSDSGSREEQSPMLGSTGLRRRRPSGGSVDMETPHLQILHQEGPGVAGGEAASTGLRRDITALRASPAVNPGRTCQARQHGCTHLGQNCSRAGRVLIPLLLR